MFPHDELRFEILRHSGGARRLWMLAGLLLVVTAGCSDKTDGDGSAETVTCGDGTRREGDECVVDGAGGGTPVRCGPGTMLNANQCVLSTAACAAGTALGGDQCVVADAACGAGTAFDAEGAVCVPDVGDPCGFGTDNSAGRCVASEEACNVGTAFDDVLGTCGVAESACGPGTILQESTCVSNASDFGCLALISCGPGTELVGSECLVELDEGSECPTCPRCGGGTARRDDECVVAASACTPGTALDTDRCVVASAACAGGTVLDSDSGQCVVASEACGPGTALGDAACEVAADACGTDTALDTGQCVSVLSCGAGTERDAEACVGTLACGKQTVQTLDEAGDDVCLYEAWAERSIHTFAERLAGNWCGSFHSCGCTRPFTGFGGEDLALVGDQEEGNCLKWLTFSLDSAFGFPDARVLEAAERTVTWDDELAERVENFFVANSDCEMEIDVELFASFDSIPALWSANRVSGEPCLVDLSCNAGLRCIDPDSNGQSQCLPPVAKGQPCSRDEECADGLHCTYITVTETCEDQLGEGADCSGSDEACGDGLSCFYDPDADGTPSYICDAIDDTPFKCDSSDDCEEGFWCDQGETFYGDCVATVDLGDGCDGEDQCPPGVVCAGPEGDRICTLTPSACEFGFFNN